MIHNFIDESFSRKERAGILLLRNKDFDIDHQDNLDELPDYKGVYAICGRVNGSPANCRLVGKTDNIRQAVKEHYSDREPDPVMKEYMRSIKTKVVFFSMEPLTEEEAVDKLDTWTKTLAPHFSEVLNRVY